MKKYEAFLTTDYYIFDKDNSTNDWASEVLPDFKVETKKLGKYKTLEEAKEAINKSGDLQDYYPSCFIYSDQGEEWSSVPELDKCKCCGNEKWERMEFSI